ncbi:Uncharacterised protein [Mycobacteroides abscessus subsp. abscessus]|nr:Uncharacterised protein [Mycobacteroides abscessus subsp. abscessus]
MSDAEAIRSSSCCSGVRPRPDTVSVSMKLANRSPIFCDSVPSAAFESAASVMISRTCSSARSNKVRNAPSTARSAGMAYSASQRPLTWPNRSSCGRMDSSRWLRSIPDFGSTDSVVTRPWWHG